MKSPSLLLQATHSYKIHASKCFEGSSR